MTKSKVREIKEGLYKRKEIRCLTCKVEIKEKIERDTTDPKKKNKNWKK